MSTPTDEMPDPFEHSFAMAARSLSVDSTVETSAENTGPTTPAGAPREKKRVGFSGAQSEPVTPTSGDSTPARQGSLDPLIYPLQNKSHLPQLSRQDTEQIKEAFNRPRPVLRNTQSAQQASVQSDDEDEHKAYRKQKAREALQRGIDLERDERIRSAPVSRQSSPKRKRQRPPKLTLDNVPLEKVWSGETEELSPKSSPSVSYAEQMSNVHRIGLDGLRSGAVTPIEERTFYEDYQPPPKKYRGGILGQLLKLHDNPPPYLDSNDTSRNSSSFFGIFGRHSTSELPTGSTPATPSHSPPGSGASTPGQLTPRKGSWAFSRTTSAASLTQLVASSSGLGTPAVSGLSEEAAQRLKAQKRPHLKDRVKSSANAISKHVRSKRDEEHRIKKHIDEILQRERFLIKLCKGLMMYGAPSHRLEEYVKMSARVLEIQVQVLYIPGAMWLSFDDPVTHTSSTQLVKAPQGIDLGKLRDVHEIYKDVLHDNVGVKHAKDRLNAIFDKPPKHKRWLLILMYGLASVCVGPFAFGARFTDLPICFLLGALVGFLQLFVAVQGDLYSSIFEILAAIVTSFLARMFGSINNGGTFCFSALAQSSIALILPGYIVLLASLELISKSIVAGSVRMVYAIIYSLFLGYGITLGTAFYGIIDHNAVSKTTCNGAVSELWYFLFVPGFTLCLIIINQAKWKQAPLMLIISSVGYVANHFITQAFHGNTQIGNMVGAFAIGVLANGYSRVGGKLEYMALTLWKGCVSRWRALRRAAVITPKSLEEGEKKATPLDVTPLARRAGYTLAAAAMLPAIFVQVPSGLSVGGSLLTGLASANAITTGNMNDTQISNITSADSVSQLNTVAFNVAYSVVQIAIGITVGLFVAAICIYPLGKRRSGLFSF